MTETHELPNGSYIRLSRILKIIPVSRSTWYRGVAAGIYPKPVKISTRASAWKAEEIRKYLEDIATH